MQHQLVLAVLLLFLLSPVAPQSCEVVTTSLCEPIIYPGTSVFVPAGTTIDFLQEAAVRSSVLVSVSSIGDLCKSYGLQMICASYLRPCYTTDDNVTLPIPMELCNQVCQAVTYGCSLPGSGLPDVPIGYGTYFPPGYGPPANCSDPPIDRLAFNMAFYQTGNATVLYNNVNYSIPCNQQELVVPPITQNCEAPLVPNAQGGCAFSCPLPSLPDSEYENVKTMQGVLGWFSWCATAALILLLVFCPRARAFPRNMIIMTACAANIAAGAIILPTYAGYEKVWCGGGAFYQPITTIVGVDSQGLPEVSVSLSESVLDFTSPLCSFQGAMLQFGFLAAVFWWALIAFNMSFELYLGELLNLDKKKWKWLRFGIYNLVGWGLAFLLMVIPASAGEIKFAPAGTYCFVSIADDNNAWSLTFWFLPVGISVILGITLFSLALVRITILFITIRKVKKLVLLYLRLFVFILLYLVLIIFITAYYIHNATNQDHINNGYENYYLCLLYGLPNCSLDDSVTNYNLVMLKSFAISSLGLLLFFLFLSWDVLVFWWGLGVSVYYLSIRRTKSNAMVVLHKLAYSQSTRTITKGSGSALTVTIGEEGAGQDPDEDDDEEEENDAEELQAVDKPESESSSSSE